MWQFTHSKFDIDKIKNLRNSTEFKKIFMDKMINEKNYKPLEIES